MENLIEKVMEELKNTNLTGLERSFVIDLCGVFQKYNHPGISTEKVLELFLKFVLNEEVYKNE